MYFWNTNALAIDIKNNIISEVQKKNYYLALSIFMTIAWYMPPMLSAFITPSEKIIEGIVGIVILILGVNITFKTHLLGKSNESYIEKIILLSFPLTIKFTLLLALFDVLIVIISKKYAFIEIREVIASTLYLMIQVIVFWRLNIYLKIINNKEQS